MISIYQGFKNYYDKERKKIDYFLDVLKRTDDEVWEYEFHKRNFNEIDICFEKKIKYKNVEIEYSYYHNVFDNVICEHHIIVSVDNNTIFEFEAGDYKSDLYFEIVDLIERAEQRGRK